MPIDPTTIIRGPAVIKRGTTIIYTETDVKVTPEIATIDGSNSIHGKYDEYIDTVMYKIAFKPASQVTAAILAELFPYSSVALGSSIFGSASSVIIWSVDGKQYTYKYAALTKMPNLKFAAGAALFDSDAEYTALGDPEEAWATAGHIESLASVSFTDTSFDRTKDLRLHYMLDWAIGAPWNTLKTESGITVTPSLGLKNVLDDEMGIVDMTISEISASASFVPRGVTAADIVAARGLQGAGAHRGMRQSSHTASLTISTGTIGDPYCVLANCVLDSSVTGFGTEVNRVGEITLKTLNTPGLLLSPLSLTLLGD